MALDAETALPSNVETASLLGVTVEGRGQLEAVEVIPRSDLSTSKRTYIPSPAEERGKNVAVDGDESGSDIDLEEIQMFDEGLTRVEVRMEGSTRNIIIPLNCNLLTIIERVVPSLVPLCTSTESRTLQTFKDADLSLGISGMALRVSF